jgi:precorrin-4/cobalt-precorrin-4 C11-methyltransferase
LKVYFIGAGPGAADLITIRGANILALTPLVMYAGSLIPPAVLSHCRVDAKIINTAELNLDEQIEYFRQAKLANHDVARVHSGDPSIYGATAEQMRRLDELGIKYEVIPGVSSFTAAAATICSELTKPEISQSIILTRVSGRASSVPECESIANLAQHKATMCIFLSGPHLKQIVCDLKRSYAADTPIALVYRASWPDERVYQGTLARVLDEVDICDWKLTTLLIIGDVLNKDVVAESRLYSASYSHKFRPMRKKEEAP